MGAMTRIYIPTTTSGLHRLREVHQCPGLTAHAVTPGLREWYVDGDEEDLEYSAFIRAAQDVLPLLREDAGSRRRRAVVSADVDEAAMHVDAPRLGDSRIRLTGATALSAVAAIHVDSADAEPVVAAAVEALCAAEAGDADAEFIIDSAEDCALEWYAPSELGQLLPMLR